MLDKILIDKAFTEDVSKVKSKQKYANIVSHQGHANKIKMRYHKIPTKLANFIFLMFKKKNLLTIKDWKY